MRVLLTSTDTVAETLGVGFGIGLRADLGSLLVQGQNGSTTEISEINNTHNMRIASSLSVSVSLPTSTIKDDVCFVREPEWNDGVFLDGEPFSSLVA